MYCWGISLRTTSFRSQLSLVDWIEKAWDLLRSERWCQLKSKPSTGEKKPWRMENRNMRVTAESNVQQNCIFWPAAAGSSHQYISTTATQPRKKRTQENPRERGFRYIFMPWPEILISPYLQSFPVFITDLDALLQVIKGQSSCCVGTDIYDGASKAVAHRDGKPMNLLLRSSCTFKIKLY